MSASEPSPEELQAAFEEQLKRISVDEVLLQTVVTLINLCAHRLGLGPPSEEAPPRDLPQARQAIDALRALVPLLAADESAQVKQTLSQLQIAYAREAQGAGEPARDPASAKPAGAEGAGGEQERPAEPAQDEAERAKARAKIWTPPGT